MTNQELINKFFESYVKHDLDGIRQVMSDKVIWYFLGQHKLAGIKRGIQEVVAFFDAMGSVMGKSKPAIEKLIVAENSDHLIECQHITTHRPDGINIDHYVSVLWTIENEKIVSGRHFFADPQAVDQYFNAVAKIDLGL